MRGLDTNLLVRYLTQDEPGQARRAARWIEEAVTAGEGCFLGQIVLCELVWVLRGSYGYGKADLVRLLETLLATAEFVIEGKDLVREALADFRRGPGDFADHLLGRRNRREGCTTTGTFDRVLKGSALFTVLMR